MTSQTVQDIVDSFAREVTEQLDESKLDGPVRLDPTRSIVIIPVKGKGPIHAYTNHEISDEGVRHVVNQIRAVPSLKDLLKGS